MTRRKTRKPAALIDTQRPTRRHHFFRAVPALSLLMLVLFIVAAALVLVFPRPFSPASWNALRDFLLNLAIVLILSVGLGLYVAAVQPRLLQNHLRGSVFLLLLIVCLIGIRVGVLRGWSPYLIVLPTLLVAIILTIAYDQRFALGISAFFLLISVFALAHRPMLADHALGVLLAAGAATGIAVLALRQIRTRTRLIEVGALAAAVVLLIIWIHGLWIDAPPAEILRHSLLAAAGTLAVGFVIQGLLPLIEKLFGVATALTLLDYSEPNRPLLRRLAVDAPGTFNHSLQIGMLAESAADAIGANGLLCRVGSYYHDIGKIVKPRYFVENQAQRINQHKELSPTMSRMIIIGHVRDGIELARQYRLPRILHQFIETHHGTTLVEYFYHEASKKEAQAGRSVVESEFRYPGPKPYTREAAIVMLTDAVESATRALKDPTPTRIENLVHTIALKRLQDGQFDDCDLTMQELRLIEAALVRSLCAMYHSRIAYPSTQHADKLPSAI